MSIQMATYGLLVWARLGNAASLGVIENAAKLIDSSEPSDRKSFEEGLSFVENSGEVVEMYKSLVTELDK